MEKRGIMISCGSTNDGNTGFEKFKSSANFSITDCMICGFCSSACPLSGESEFDPRKLVRLVNIGLELEAVESEWPWMCTMCGRCETECPMEVNISDLVRNIRSKKKRKSVPGILQKGLEAAIETGNNLRLPEEDFIYIVEDVGEEIASEPGFSDFSVPINKKNANLLVTIHNKLVNTHTEDLKHFWRIFHIAREDWTITSVNWEGTSWGMFTGDDEAIRIMAGRIVSSMEELNIGNLLWPE